MINHILTLGIGLLGAMVFLGLNIPLPWLFGPLSACLLAALYGVKLKTSKPVSDGMRTILGVAAGATINMNFFYVLPTFWNTLLLVPLMIIFIGIIGVWYFQRFCGYDFTTAYYSAMPGGLQDMILFGEEAGGNVRAISLIHATRILIIVVLLPILLTNIWHINLDSPPGEPASTITIDQMIILIICALAGWKIAERLGLFGASILGPLIFAALASLLGLLHMRPPAEAIWASQYFIALGIGVKYVGITTREIRYDIVAGAGFSLILLALTIMILAGIMVLDLAPPLEALLSLSPGGQAELVVLALVAGVDIGFVVAHHLLRLFLVILCAPIVARFVHSKPLR